MTVNINPTAANTSVAVTININPPGVGAANPASVIVPAAIQVANPVLASPNVGSPAIANPFAANPVAISPVAASPVVDSPVAASPIAGNPVAPSAASLAVANPPSRCPNLKVIIENSDDALATAHSAQKEPSFQSDRPNLVFFCDGSRGPVASADGMSMRGGYATVYKNTIPGPLKLGSQVVRRFRVLEAHSIEQCELMGILESMGIGMETYQHHGEETSAGCVLRIFTDSQAALERIKRGMMAQYVNGIEVIKGHMHAQRLDLHTRPIVAGIVEQADLAATMNIPIKLRWLKRRQTGFSVDADRFAGKWAHPNVNNERCEATALMDDMVNDEMAKIKATNPEADPEAAKMARAGMKRERSTPADEDHEEEQPAKKRKLDKDGQDMDEPECPSKFDEKLIRKAWILMEKEGDLNASEERMLDFYLKRVGHLME